MSKTSLKERNKAIRLAWEREQELVSEGKGTRDWSQEQQKDILDPEKGKAYDENGRAFEGQHMKSAAEYPEYQGDPNNIQFLTREEHLEAHKGSWQNPTNWYFDPTTKEYTDFGDNAATPCKIIDLSDSVVIIKAEEIKESVEQEQNARNEHADIGTHADQKSTDNAPPKSKVQSESSTANDRSENPKTARAGKTTVKSTSVPISPDAMKTPKEENGFVKGLKNVGRFIVEHPLETIEIAGVVIGGTLEIVSAVSGSHSKSGGTSTSSSKSGATPTEKTDIAAKVADIVEKATRAENDVSGHKQRYHTKNGVIWKDKAPYHRGRKKN